MHAPDSSSPSDRTEKEVLRAAIRKVAPSSQRNKLTICLISIEAGLGPHNASGWKIILILVYFKCLI